MTKADDLTSRLEPGSPESTLAGASSTPVIVGLLLLGTVVLLLFAYMYYREWRLKKRLKAAQPKREPVPFCATARVPGITLAEVRRAREAGQKTSEPLGIRSPSDPTNAPPS